MTEPPPHPGDPFFAGLADHLGSAYLRYSFTMGTDQEAGFILETLDLEAGARVLDVGCGPGRHAVPLALAGLAITGVDVSRRFLDIAAESARAAGVGAAFFEVDARQMPFEDEFDAVISLCQGAFGLMGKDDALILRRMTEALKPGGVLLLTAFSAYYAARYQTDADLDADAGLIHERSELKDEQGTTRDFDMWTGVYTPRELRLLAIGVGLVPDAVWAVAPGDYARRVPDADHPEFMMLARKP